MHSHTQAGDAVVVSIRYSPARGIVAGCSTQTGRRVLAQQFLTGLPVGLGFSLSYLYKTLNPMNFGKARRLLDVV